MRPSSKPPRQRGILIQAALAIAVSCTADIQAEEPAPVDASRYQRTVGSLRQAPPEVRSVFAETALTELVTTYLAEADLARSEATDSEERAKLLGWSLAVEGYARDMLVLLDDVQRGAAVSLASSRHEVARLTVSGRSIFLSHPRAAQQAEFEQRILMDFCSRVECAPLIAGETDAQPVPVSAPLVNPSWAFAPGSARCAYRELSVHFRGEGDLARRRSLCNQLFQELAVLANELTWQKRHGVAIEWQALSIHPVPRQPEHIVILNSTGDSILASLPLIHSTPGLLPDVTPWLKAGHAGSPPPPLELEPGRYGWEAPVR